MKPVLLSERNSFGISVNFKHGCTGHTIRYPVVSTCALNLTLPVPHMSTFQDFKSNMETAIVNGMEFGRASERIIGMLRGHLRQSFHRSTVWSALTHAQGPDIAISSALLQLKMSLKMKQMMWGCQKQQTFVLSSVTSAMSCIMLSLY